MTYPVNVGRNIARETANSHYIFPSDIELYPSPGLIPAILKMVTSGEEEALKRPNPKVFVSSIFEIKEGHDLPETKAELLKLLKSKVVIPFHKMVCSQCHAIPKAQEWITDPISGIFVRISDKYLRFDFDLSSSNLRVISETIMVVLELCFHL